MYITKDELKRLTLLMIDHDLYTNKDLAEAVGVHRTYVSALTTGRHRCIPLRKKIARYFGVSYYRLWTDHAA